MKYIKTGAIHKASLLTLLLLLLFAIPLYAGSGDIVIPANPNIADRRDYVADPAGLVPAIDKAEANATLYALRLKTSVEAAAVVVPTIGDLTPAEYCEKVFTAWGLGKRDKDNGVLLLIDTGGRQAFIMTGYGAEGALPDITCADIINTTVVPAMKEGDLGKALTSAVSKISEVLSDPAVAEELRSQQADNFSGREGALPTLDPKTLRTALYWLAALAFLFGLVCMLRDIRNSRKLDNYDRSMIWRRHLTAYWIAAALSLGTGVIFALVALFSYRRARNAKVKCPVCGEKMEKLDEASDNEYLSSSQDLEERLNTVDYDVWRCPKCHAVERFPYRTRQLTYSECPKCHTVAMRLKNDVTVRPATTVSSGTGVRTYECLFCHHEEKKPYTIPRKPDRTAAAVAAGAAARASRGSRGFGGGGFGGGFGGGRTGGGGGGGRW